MSENNNKNIDFNDEKEPIESIEKTVEDLKKKIEELSQEKESEAVQHSDESKAKIQEITDTTVKTVLSSIQDIKEKAQQVSENPDVQKTIAYIKENAVKAVDLAKGKISEISQDPKVKEYTNKTVDTLKSVKDTAGKYVDEHLNEKQKNDLAKASEKVSESTKKIVTAANDFYNKPEVQDTIEKVKVGANDLMEKGSEAVKHFFSKKDEK